MKVGRHTSLDPSLLVPPVFCFWYSVLPALVASYMWVAQSLFIPQQINQGSEGLGDRIYRLIDSKGYVDTKPFGSLHSIPKP